MKNGDVILGTIGSTATFTLGALNVWLGICAGVLTVSVMAIKLRREWRHRDLPPDDPL